MLLPLAGDHRRQRLKPLDSKPSGHLLVHEVYRSIQGESTFAGLPCVFVRLTGCAYRCSWCDTPHAFKEGTLRSLGSVLEAVTDLRCPLVELTGGEPLHQEESLPLMSALADRGMTVLLETSGAEPIDRVDRRVHVIMDLKCPDSGECENNHWQNLKWLKPTDQIKLVIASRRDFDWAATAIREHSLDRRFAVLLSCVFGKVRPVELAEWLLDSQIQVRMQLQYHKYIWAPDARGV